MISFPDKAVFLIDVLSFLCQSCRRTELQWRRSVWSSEKYVICVVSIDLLPNYGPGTSKRYRKPVTTGNTVISYCEKINFRRSSDLAEAKMCLFAVLFIFDMPSTNHFFWSFLHTSRHNDGFGGVFWGVCFRTLDAVVSRFWQRFRRLGPLKIGLVILTNLRKC